MTREAVVRTTEDRIAELLRKDIDELTLDVISPGVTPTKLKDVEYGMRVDIAGIVRSIDSKTEFTRKDGSPGQVRGVRIQDSTADIRCACWGDHADFELSQGDPLLLRNVEIQDGWQDDIEASVGWQSEMELLEELDIEYVTIQLRGSSEAAESPSTDSSDEESDGSDGDEDAEETPPAPPEETETTETE